MKSGHDLTSIYILAEMSAFHRLSAGLRRPSQLHFKTIKDNMADKSVQCAHILFFEKLGQKDRQTIGDKMADKSVHTFYSLKSWDRKTDIRTNDYYIQDISVTQT